MAGAERGLQQPQLCHKAAGRGKAGQGKGGEKEDKRLRRFALGQPAQLRQLTRAGLQLHLAAAHQQGSLHQLVVHEKQNCQRQAEAHAKGAGRKGHSQPHQHIANLADDVKAQQSANRRLRKCTQHADCHCQARNGQQQRLPGEQQLREKEREGAKERIDADLGQHTAKQCRDCRMRRVIGTGQPEEEGEHRCLAGEGDQQQSGNDGLDGGRCVNHALTDLRHVQRAQCAIGNARPQQEHHRPHQVEHHIANAGVDLAGCAAQRQQHKAGHQQHFVEHIQVEEVAGDKSPVCPHQQQQRHRVITQPRAGLVERC